MRKTRVLFCGAGMSGNMGAPALYLSLAKTLREISEDHYDITILSKYPKDDEDPCKNESFDMVAYPTTVQLLAGVPFFFFGGILKLLRLPYNWLARGALRAYIENDVLADLSGISFSDDRSFSSLVINALWLLPAIITGIPIVKVSQSMGPFTKPAVRCAARLFLAKTDVLIARGELSYKYLRDFFPSKDIYNLPDIAFCLPTFKEAAKKKLAEAGITAGYNVIGPSILLSKKMGDEQYKSIMLAAACRLYECSCLPCVLLPHTRSHTNAVGVDSVSDDITVCRALENELKARGIPCIVFDGAEDPRLFKGIVSGAETAVGSRYHFMISAIGSATPALCLGWSHKYTEMMKMFDLESWGFSHQTVLGEAFADKAGELWANRAGLREQIESALPDVIVRSAQNAALVAAAAQKKGRA